MDMVWYLSPQETHHGIHTSFSWLMRESETMAKILCVLMVVYHAIMRFGIWECAYIIHFRSLKLFFFFFGKMLLFYTFWCVSTDRHCSTQWASRRRTSCNQAAIKRHH